VDASDGSDGTLTTASKDFACLLAFLLATGPIVGLIMVLLLIWGDDNSWQRRVAAPAVLLILLSDAVTGAAPRWPSHVVTRLDQEEGAACVRCELGVEVIPS
jgi:hypothetical protein